MKKTYLESMLAHIRKLILDPTTPIFELTDYIELSRKCVKSYLPTELDAFEAKLKEFEWIPTREELAQKAVLEMIEKELASGLDITQVLMLIQNQQAKNLHNILTERGYEVEMEEVHMDLSYDADVLMRRSKDKDQISVSIWGEHDGQIEDLADSLVNEFHELIAESEVAV